MRSDRYSGDQDKTRVKSKGRAGSIESSRRDTVVMDFEDLQEMEKEFAEKQRARSDRQRRHSGDRRPARSADQAASGSKTVVVGDKKRKPSRSVNRPTEEERRQYMEARKYDAETEKQMRKEDKAVARAEKRRGRKAAAGYAGASATGGKGGKKKGGCLKIILILIVIIAILFGGLFFFIHSKLSKMQKVETKESDFKISKEANDKLSNYRNIAVLGIDARQNESFKGSRSDAIVIVSIDKNTGNIKLISVMRDSYLYFVGYDDKTLVLDKVTHAHAFGGPTNTCLALNKALDLNIKEFVVLDWKAVADTVDNMGGVEIEVKQNELRDLNRWGPETARNTNRTWHRINSPGKYNLDGAQAATYCRIRKTSGGDTGRNDRYKKVMAALLSRAKHSPGKVNSTMDKVFPQIQTNMSTMQIMKMIPIMATMKIDKSIGWPYKYWGGIIRGKWLAVPKTLESNNKKLHKEAFDDPDYELSDQAKRINDMIINNTGIQ